MHFDNCISNFQDYQTIKDEKQILLDKLYTNEKRRKYHVIKPFNK